MKPVNVPNWSERQRENLRLDLEIRKESWWYQLSRPQILLQIIIWLSGAFIAFYTGLIDKTRLELKTEVLQIKETKLIEREAKIKHEIASLTQKLSKLTEATKNLELELRNTTDQLERNRKLIVDREKTIVVLNDSIKKRDSVLGRFAIRNSTLEKKNDSIQLQQMSTQFTLSETRKDRERQIYYLKEEIKKLKTILKDSCNIIR